MAQNEDPQNNQDPQEEQPTTAGEANSNLNDEYKDLKLDETFLPETKEEEAEAEPASTQEPQVPEKREEAVTTSETPVTTEQPNTSQNAEIVDKTQGEGEPKLYAGKYKSVEELRKGIEELGGDPTGIDDPTALEQSYLAVQKVYNRFTQRQDKAEEIATPKEEPKPFEINDDLVEGMMNELDFTKIDNAKDLAKQQFSIIFKHLKELLPQMMPQQQPGVQMNPQEMAAAVERVQTNTDSLAFIEAKIPRLTTDQSFRRNFAMHLQAGKESGSYPDIMTRENMTQAMRDFLKTAQEMAAEASKLDGAQQQQNAEDKGAAGTPDGGGAPASTQTTTNPEDDLLDSIVGAKEEQDKKLLF